jgi:flagellar basal body P-ring formation protein FlgA
MPTLLKLPRNRLPIRCLRRPALLCTLAAITAGTAMAGTVAPRELALLAERAVAAQIEQSGLARGASRVEVSAGALDSRLNLDSCAKPPRVEVDLTRLQRRMNAKVSCSAPSPWSIYVPVELHVYRMVVVSARELQTGSPLTASDLQLAERDVIASSSPTLQSPDQALGLTLRRPLAANTPITSNLLLQQLLVRRGDRLSIRSKSGAIAVQTVAEALENGRNGERIRVKNVQSKRIVDVVITGPGEAQTL